MQEIETLTSSPAFAQAKSIPLAEQVSFDLRTFLSSSKDPKKKLGLLSKKIGVHLKTLNRILNLESKPSYSSVFKIYRFLLNENDDAKLLPLCPETVREYLIKANPQKINALSAYSPEFELEILNSEIALELIVLCSTSHQLTSTEIKERFGSFGIEVARRLVEKKILVEVKLDIFTIGKAQINLTPEIVIKMGLQIASTYAKAENGYELGLHYHSFYAEGLNAEAYQEWLKIDKEAFEKKVLVAKKPTSQGKIRAYTFQSTDTLNKKDSP